MSQEDLAKAANVDVKTVRDFELGKRWPWAQTRSAIAKALQVPALTLQAVADGGPEPTAGPTPHEEELTALDEFERSVLAADLPYTERAAAIRRHRQQAREMLDELGIEVPEFFKRGARRLAGAPEPSNAEERNRGA